MSDQLNKSHEITKLTALNASKEIYASGDITAEIAANEEEV